MRADYDKWYEEFRDSMNILEENDLFEVMDKLVGSSKGNISMNRKLMEKVIDVSWVETIENSIIHLDNVIRNPGRTIIDVEEIVPIALSRKITVESVKHLAQRVTPRLFLAIPRGGTVLIAVLLHPRKDLVRQLLNHSSVVVIVYRYLHCRYVLS